MARSRLTPLDSSFLRVESPTAHMHVGWKGIFSPRSDPRHGWGGPSIGELRQAVSGRLRHAPRFRQRLAFPPAGLGEPVWVDDERFSVEHHVVAMSGAHEALPRARFDALADDCLSRPLERDRALWRIELAPMLEDGNVGLVMKVHHAMVDGKSAVELALLLLDMAQDADLPQSGDDWTPAVAPGARRLAMEAIADAGGESLRAVRSAARLASSPRGGVRLADTLRRAALAVSEDVMRPAPSSYVNVAIGPRRTLVHHTTPIKPLLAARKALVGATLNDVALTVVAGALRDLSLRSDRVPEPMKIMVPVSTRTAEETVDLGNRISFVFIELPVHLHRPADRLVRIQEATARFKKDDRASGGEAILGALGVLPDPLRDAAAKLAASPRMYNLTVSNVPGPRFPVYLRGCELQEAAPVIPLPDHHALSIGIFTYRDQVTFSGYADPAALPDVVHLPDAIAAAIAQLDQLQLTAAPAPPPLPANVRRITAA
ncbi:Putative diacylglycerol O-acyltransferase [Paraconexibacter sp. AEG42_29]|uniref:Diacylglycerol O-acyltransferase n=1 Tax=Paraconexibacter sp. AEG42_29 TaxID=2997339 RepID=A0AAU7AZJ7_9ACTN